MGLSLQYSGTLANTGNISKIRAELVNLSTTLNWSHREWNDDWAKPADAKIELIDGKKKITGHFSLKGATVHYSPKAEAAALLFNSEGALKSPMSILGGAATATLPIKINIEQSSADDYIWLMGIFKYMKKHYMPDLSIIDETGYWETNDRSALEAKLSSDSSSNNSPHQYNADQIASKLETMFKLMRA